MSWFAWALIIIGQNFAFTFVSRARNSGSLPRHIIAAIFSNLIFFVQFAFITDKTANAMMHGEMGRLAQVGIALFYTVWTVSGSVLAHYFSLKTEKGSGAVGANKKYAQIPTDEWNAIKAKVLN